MGQLHALIAAHAGLLRSGSFTPTGRPRRTIGNLKPTFGSPTMALAATLDEGVEKAVSGPALRL